MKRIVAGIFVCSMFSFVGAGCMTEVGSEDGDPDVGSYSDDDVSFDLTPDGKGHITFDNALTNESQPQDEQAKGTATTNGINYHNGPVMTSPIKLYYIWYGNWSGNSATTILTDLAKNIGGSSYWNINTTYTNGSGTKVSGSVSYGGSTTDSYSKGTALSDTSIRTIVTNAIGSGKLPKDANGIYFVLTSSDVNATSGFCTQYCGWHTYTTYNSTKIKYSFVGNADRCPSACSAQSSSPNGNAGADAMASIIAHEADEAATDPQLNAWYDSSGYENADKCAWTWGSTWSSGGGAANIHLGSRDYLIQRNWVNAGGGYCSMSY